MKTAFVFRDLGKESSLNLYGVLNQKSSQEIVAQSKCTACYDFTHKHASNYFNNTSFTYIL